MYRKLLSALICASLLTIAASPVQAGDKAPTNPKVYGKTIGEWSAAWWQWAYSIPEDENPVKDETGEDCDVGQPDGKVWFLAGSFGITGVERTCTIPADKALFFPLVNAVWLDCPCPDCEPGEADADIPDDIVRWIMATFAPGGDVSCQLTCTVDGVAASAIQQPTVRTQSPIFSVTLPENHVASICGADPTPPGEYDRAIADGYWVMLPPLSPGEHTIELHGAGCDSESGEAFFETGVTYNITVTDDDEDDDD